MELAHDYCLERLEEAVAELSTDPPDPYAAYDELEEVYEEVYEFAPECDARKDFLKLFEAYTDILADPEMSPDSQSNDLTKMVKRMADMLQYIEETL